MFVRFGLVFMLVVTLTAAGLRPTVGTITSTGRFHVEGAEVWGQGTILDGSAINTGKSASRLLLRNGSDLRLASTSDGQVFANKIVLGQGAIEGLLSPALSLETIALGLSVRGNNARGHVRVEPDGSVTVASLQGALRVTNQQGQLLASLSEGNAVQLSQSATGATASTKLTGELKSRNYRYFLTDEATGITVEVRGGAAAKYAGKRVTITGDVLSSAKPADGAEYVVELSELEVATSSAPLGAGASKAAGVGILTKVGIIGGIAVAGATTTGLVIAGSDESKQTVSPQP